MALTNKYHTWCIRDDLRIQSNENNFILTYHGTVKCGALVNSCQWQATIMTHPEGQFPNQQIWEITEEKTGFTSFKETLTVRGGAKQNQGWLVAKEKEVALKITNADDVDSQWIVQTAPECV